MANMDRLFQMQKVLDDRIVKEHGLEGQNLLPKKILALLTELGELANEWRGFKFWSNDQDPRIKTICEDCGGDGVTGLYDDVECFCENTTNPLLEEYVDCLHFILSIGNEKAFSIINHRTKVKLKTITEQFNKLFYKIGDFSQYRTPGNYEWLLDLFIGLGEMLGFTWSQIEQAYFNKNKINHERQDGGY